MQVNPLNQTPDVVPVVEKVEKIAPVPQALRSEKGNESATSSGQQSSAEKLRELQAAMAAENITLRIHRDEATEQMVIEMVDSTTGSPIRQMPSEVSLRLEAAYTKLMGQFVNKTA